MSRVSFFLHHINWTLIDPYFFRNYFEVLAGCGPDPPPVTKDTFELTHEVLESLFNAPKSSKHEPGSMNWRNVVKKMESLGQKIDYPSEDPVKKQHIPGKRKTT